MGFIRNLLDRFLESDEYFEEEERLWDEEYFWQEERSNSGLDVDEEEPEPIQSSETEWDWDTITNERTFLKISDPYQREKLIRSLVEQVKKCIRRD